MYDGTILGRRASRKEFRALIVAIFVISIFANAIDWESWAGIATGAAAMMSVRRLHDIDRSAWWLLVVLVPVAGFCYLAALLVGSHGDVAANRFGSPPRL